MRGKERQVWKVVGMILGKGRVWMWEERVLKEVYAFGVSVEVERKKWWVGVLKGKWLGFRMVTE